MGKLNYMMAGLLVLALSACSQEDVARLTAGIPTTDDTIVTPPATCWSDLVALNGAENLPYPTESQTAGNTFYACYGQNAAGNTQGLWLGFYSNGTVYFGIPGVLATATLDQESCAFTFMNGATELGVATAATLDSENKLTSIDMSVNVLGESIHFDCHVTN